MDRRLTALLVAASLLAPAAVLARSYDPQLGTFYDPKTLQIDNAGFRNYASELGIAVSPKMLGPAATLGSLGWEFSLSVGMSDIAGDASYWHGAAEDPGNLLITNQIRVRKGLPYSLEIGGIITHLYQSGMWGIGLELGWTLHEGFEYFPDIGIITSVNTLLGSDDLAMLEVGAGFIISKSFSVAGLFTLEPYTGFDLVYVNASSHLTSMYPVDSVTGKPLSTPSQFAIGQQNLYNYRWVLGLNMVASYVTAGFEATTNLTGSGGKPWTYAFKLGVTF